MSSEVLRLLIILRISECSLRQKKARLTSGSGFSSWPTPTATLAKQGRGGPGTSLLDRVLIEEFGLPDPVKSPEAGNRLASLRKRYELNPEWLEQLMGLPLGWTNPTDTLPRETQTLETGIA
jgi:hypothetical protein